MDGFCTILQRQRLHGRMEWIRGAALPIVTLATGKHSVGVYNRASFSHDKAQAAVSSSIDTSTS